MYSWQTALVMLGFVILLMWLLNKRDRRIDLGEDEDSLPVGPGVNVSEVTDSGREIPMPRCDLDGKTRAFPRPDPLASQSNVSPHWHSANRRQDNGDQKCPLFPSIPPRNVSKGQLAACKHLEQRLGAPLEWNVRPDFLRSPVTGRNLELDCYNADHKIALEFQGKHHKTFPHRFHGNDPQNFIRSIQRDLYKKEVCETVGIYLIEVDEGMRPADMTAYIDQHFDYYSYLKRRGAN